MVSDHLKMYLKMTFIGVHKYSIYTIHHCTFMPILICYHTDNDLLDHYIY